MKILEYVKSLLPVVTKANIEQDIATTRNEFEKIVLPMYNTAFEQFRVMNFKSSEVKKLEADFYKRARVKVKSPNFIGDIRNFLQNALSNLEVTAAQVAEVMERDVLNEGLTARKAHLLRSAEVFAFMSRFAPDFLNYITVLEAKAYKATEISDISPAKVKYIVGRIDKFFSLMNEYGMDPKTFKNSLTKIPEVGITSGNTDSIKGVFKPEEIDPFSSSLISNFVGSPIYHIRLAIAEWQANRYKAAQDKKKMLELRLLYLKSMETEESNPQLEKEINYINGRIEKVDRYLQEVEESVPERK